MSYLCPSIKRFREASFAKQQRMQHLQMGDKRTQARTSSIRHTSIPTDDWFRMSHFHLRAGWIVATRRYFSTRDLWHASKTPNHTQTHHESNTNHKNKRVIFIKQPNSITTRQTSSATTPSTTSTTTTVTITKRRRHHEYAIHVLFRQHHCRFWFCGHVCRL